MGYSKVESCDGIGIPQPLASHELRISPTAKYESEVIIICLLDLVYISNDQKNIMRTLAIGEKAALYYGFQTRLKLLYL